VLPPRLRDPDPAQRDLLRRDTFLPCTHWARRRVNGCYADGRSGCIVLHLEYIGVARCPYRYYSKSDCDHDETSVETGQEDVGAADKAKNRLHRRGEP